MSERRVIDSIVGGCAGAGLAVAQGLVGSGPWIGIVLHALALGIVGALMMVETRHLARQPLRKTLVMAVLFVIFMTLVISAIDYSYLFIF